MNTTVKNESARYRRTSKSLAACMLLAMAAGCSATPIEEHAPKTPQEAVVLSVLVRYTDAKKHFDLERYLGCLHPRGTYALETNSPVSKERLESMLSRLWAGLKAGDPTVLPMARECVNGNHFTAGRFVDPQIVVDRNRAQATLIFSLGWWHLKHYVFLVFEDDRWMIDRLDWKTK